MSLTADWVQKQQAGTGSGLQGSLPVCSWCRCSLSEAGVAAALLNLQMFSDVTVPDVGCGGASRVDRRVLGQDRRITPYALRHAGV